MNKELEKIAEQLGDSKERLISNLEKNIIRVSKMRKSEDGKYRVLGIDKFSGEEWVEAEYCTAEEALQEARKLTKDSMSYATHADIATVFYAYDPKGRYLGGDVFNNE
ncbi:MAG: hypothetical protein KKA79_02080 [Nanoarchaeota archaeon]|nr:hypothetical protein [Nanoarchaeota archaeon]